MTSIVLWVEDLQQAESFYTSLLSAESFDSSAEFIRISGAGNEVLLHLLPEQYRSGISVPPQVREESVMKPIFKVASIETSRAAVDSTNGLVKSQETVQAYGEVSYCDGFDPEGNVFQLAEAR